MLFLLIFLLIPSWVHAAITVDAVTLAGNVGIGINVTEASLSHTAAADATLALVCVTERDTTATMGAGPSVTYAGNAMTLVDGATQTQGSFLKSSLFYYVSPPSGSQTINVTASTNSDREVVSAITLKGTATTSIFNTAGTMGSEGTTNIDIDSLASAVGEFAVMCGAQSTNTPNVSADATAPVSDEQVEADHTDGIGLTHFIYTEAGATTSIDMRVDSDSSQRTSAVAVSIRPAVSGQRPIAPMILQ